MSSIIVMPMQSRCHILLIALGICLSVTFAFGCATRGGRAGSHGDRDLPNFHQVNAGLYRGAQPTRAGFERLKDIGVRTVLIVRGGDMTQQRLDGLALTCEQRTMSPWKPSDGDVVWFLQQVTDPARQPVFIHCQHGADRTGYLIAMYRVIVDGWSRERAINEMTADGMGFHDLFQGLIEYVREADVERLRAAMMSQ